MRTKSLILATMIVATCMTSIPMTINSTITTSAASETSVEVPYYLNKDMIASERETAMANRTYVGDFVDPNSIKSANSISFITSGHSAVQLDVDDFFDINRKSAFATSKNFDIENDTVAVCIRGYNKTSYSLYYEMDLNTGILYQTLNTQPSKNNSVVPTVNKAFYNNAGDIKVSNLEGTIQYISSAEWLLDHPNILIPLRSINNEEEIRLEQLVRAKPDENTAEWSLASEYRLFGNIWVRTFQEVFKTNEDVETVRDTVNENVWLRSNGSAGDILKITNYYNMADGMPLFSDAKDFDRVTKTFTYTLTKDNELLPFGYGTYLIYNKNTGIYETVNSVCENYDVMSTDVIDSNSVEDKLLYHVLGGTDYDTISYNVPKQLNLTNTEYVDVIRSRKCVDNLGTDAVIYTVNGTTKNILANSTIDNKLLSAYKLSPDNGLSYTLNDVYTVPSNTSALLTCVTNKYELSHPKFNEEFGDIDTAVKNVIDNIATPKTYIVDNNDNICEYNNIEGDVNQDGKFNVADIVLLQKWLLNDSSVKEEYNLASYVAGNFCKDNQSDVFDLCLLKRQLLNK